MNPQRHASVFSPKLVLGLTVIALGLILMVDSLHWAEAWPLLAWWPLALTAFGLARLVQDGPLSLRGHVWLMLSAAGFISQFGPWGLLERWWPVLLVWGGAVVTLRALFPRVVRARRSGTAIPSPQPTVSCDPDKDPTQVNR
jgi:hypothetical protein